MENKYEVLLFIKDIYGERFSKVVDKIKSIFKEQQCEILKKENFGERKLAYKIKNEQKAIYYYFIIGCKKEDEDIVGKITMKLNTIEDILKTIIKLYKEE